jgi:hypothetical protein
VHGEALVSLVRLRKPQLLLHAHRDQRRRGHAGEDHPEPVPLRLDDAAVVCRSQAGHELLVLGQQGAQVGLERRVDAGHDLVPVVNLAPQRGHDHPRRRLHLPGPGFCPWRALLTQAALGQLSHRGGTRRPTPPHTWLALGKVRISVTSLVPRRPNYAAHAVSSRPHITQLPAPIACRTCMASVRWRPWARSSLRSRLCSSSTSRRWCSARPTTKRVRNSLHPMLSKRGSVNSTPRASFQATREQRRREGFPEKFPPLECLDLCCKRFCVSTR